MVSYANSFPKAGPGTQDFGSAVTSFDPSEGVRKRRKKPSSSSHSSQSFQKPRIKPFERIVRLCTQRDRSEKELRDRLIKDGYALDDIEPALSRAVECGLVNDDRFADAFIRGKLSAGKGLRSIQRELQDKHGISIEPYLEDEYEYGLDDDSQVERALDFLLRHPPSAKDAWGAAYRKLINKGYTPNVTSRAVRLWNDQRTATQ